MTHEELAAKTRPELEEICKRLKISVHHKAKDETLIYKIMQQPKAMVEKAEEEQPKKPTFNNTKEEIMEALGDLTEKEGFKVDFPGDNTVIFTYRGISESVNMSIPMNVILRQAKIASKVKYAPRFVSDGSGGKVMMS